MSENTDTKNENRAIVLLVRDQKGSPTLDTTGYHLCGVELKNSRLSITI